MTLAELEAEFTKDLSDEQRALVNAKVSELKAILDEYADEARQRAAVAFALENMQAQITALYDALGYFYDAATTSAVKRT
jgi:hypothetical protein